MTETLSTDNTELEHLLEKLKECETDYNSVTPKVNRSTNWKLRIEEDENLWQSSRAEIMENYLNFTGSFPTECDKCSMACVIRCTDCQAHLCYQCDESVHSIQVLHNRSTTTENKWKVLLPSEFIDAAHRLVVKGLSSSDKQSFIISNNEVFYIRCFIAYI